MIQFNLLPNVKLAYIRAERQKHIISIVAVITIVASLVALAFLISTVKFIQPAIINNLGEETETLTAKLEETNDIDKILTVQNQLGALTSLHNAKPVTQQLFTYMYQLTPSVVTVSNINLDYAANSIEISGVAPDLVTVNKYVDTLKFTVYKADPKDPEGDLPAAFSGVVLAAFSPIEQEGKEAKVMSYTLTAFFDPLIFSSEHPDLALIVPNIITTRLQVDRPIALFEAQPVVQ